jgi:hypothetical protein
LREAIDRIQCIVHIDKQVDVKQVSALMNLWGWWPAGDRRTGRSSNMRKTFMRFQSRTFLAAALLVALAASPAIALGRCVGCGTGDPRGTPAPGPVAGVGLGYLVLAGGYYAVRRWRKQNPGE